MTITKLTAQQEASIQPFVADWIERVTEDSSDDKIRDSVAALYDSMGLDKPTVIILDNPLLIALSLGLFDPGNPPLDDPLDKLRVEVDTHLQALADNTKDQLNNKCNDQVRGQLDQVRCQIRDQLAKHYGRPVQALLKGSCDYIRGRHANNIIQPGRGLTLDSQLREQLDKQLNHCDCQLSDQLNNQAKTQLSNQLDQVREQLDKQLDLLDSHINNQLRDQFQNQPRDQFCGQLANYLNQLQSQYQNWYAPIWWTAWAGYYGFAKTIGVKFDEKKLKVLTDFVVNVSVVFAWPSICFVSRKPRVIFRGRQLHSDNSPAIEFRGQPSLPPLYFLHGKGVPAWLVKTPADKLDPAKLAKIDNVDVRREFIRKIGVERLKKEGRLIDKMEITAEVPDSYRTLALKFEVKCKPQKLNYELIDMGKLISTNDTFYAPYLFMCNPSIDAWHAEGIHEDIRSVADALKWRNQSDNLPFLVT